jgi:hypothetical protein
MQARGLGIGQSALEGAVYALAWGEIALSAISLYASGLNCDVTCEATSCNFPPELEIYICGDN